MLRVIYRKANFTGGHINYEYFSRQNYKM